MHDNSGQKLNTINYIFVNIISVKKKTKFKSKYKFEMLKYP